MAKRQTEQQPEQRQTVRLRRLPDQGLLKVQTDRQEYLLPPGEVVEVPAHIWQIIRDTGLGNTVEVVEE